IVDLIHRHFLVPSCKVDLTRYHPRPCLQYYIKRCLGPCVQDLTTPEAYAEAVRDVQLLLEGRQTDLAKSLRGRMAQAAEAEEYERAARYRDLLSTLDQLQEKQRMAAVEGDDSDVFGYHFENDMLAVNIFHLRGGKIVDRREFFWEELPESFDPGEFFSALLKQIYIDQQYVPRSILAPVDFEDREALGELLSDRRGRKVEIIVAQRGEKRSLIDLAAQNAKQSFDQRFRVMKPTGKATQEALQDALGLPELPRRIECFDISHIQGAETVASMVVWEEGKMNKSAYRKFIVRSVSGVDDFAAMREVVTRRYRRLRDESPSPGNDALNAGEGGRAPKHSLKDFPSLVLVDGGLGQLHAATVALEDLEITNQPVAAIAKREEIIYVAGQENEPVVLDRHSPV